MGAIGSMMRNEVAWCRAAEAVYMSLIIYFWGLRVDLIWVGIAYLQQFILEVVNYIEHYGLRLKEYPQASTSGGLSCTCSWNAA